jgi:hypothetical protein
MAKNKTELWNEVQELLVANKASKKLSVALEELLAPKVGGGSINPPKEVDGVMHYYCRFHECYEPEPDMVMSAGKSKGYCRAAISKWNKTNGSIKRLESEAVGAMASGDFDKAQSLAQDVKVLKDGLNDSANYDYDTDWANFEKTNVVEEVVETTEES